MFPKNIFVPMTTCVDSIQRYDDSMLYAYPNSNAIQHKMLHFYAKT